MPVIHAATISAFADELRLIKEAMSLSQLRSAAGPIAKRVGPGGAAQPMAKAAPMRNAAKTTHRGQVVPGVANMQRDYQAAQQANQQLQGAQSIL